VAVPEGRPPRRAEPALPSRGRHAKGQAGWAGWTTATAHAVGDCAGSLRDGQVLILRTAVSPGGTARIESILAERGLRLDVAFCPERGAGGQAPADLCAAPQIVSSRTERGLERAGRLFARLTPAQVPMMPEEAELVTLFASAWRSTGYLPEVLGSR
jgi:UDP-N-acetyl-D-mannosaminuronic acid dehydrogenase